jgi:hypothetical protein
VLDGILHTILGGQQLDPHEPILVIDEEQEHLLIARSWWRNGATEVTMDHLGAPLEPVLCHLWKRHAPLLVSDSSITELLHLFDLG